MIEERAPCPSACMHGIICITGAARVALAAFYCSTWMAASSVLILLNKHVMVDLGFRYPMTASGIGVVMSGMLSWFCCRVLKIVEAKNVVTPELWVKKILPVGLAMALTLWTGNEVYMHLTVSFIQMLKAAQPIILMFALFFARLEDPTSMMILSVTLTALGTALAAYGEMNMSVVGLLIMLASEICETIRLVITQHLLVELNFNPIEGLMYLAPATALFLVLGAATLEWPKILASGAVQIMRENPGYFIISSIMGFAVNGLSYAAIKVASSLTLKVLGTAKNSLIVVVGIVFLEEVVTGTQGIGYGISLIGFVWYNWIKAKSIAKGVAPKGSGSSTSYQAVPEMENGEGTPSKDEHSPRAYGK